MPTKPPFRYNLFRAFMSRAGSIVPSFGEKDAYVLNAVLEKYEDKQYVIKRPGTASVFTIHSGSSVQGSVWFNGFLYAVIDDTLYRSSGVNNSASSGSSFTAAPNPPWIARDFAQAVVFNKNIFLIGAGVDSTNTPKGDVWSTADGFNWRLATSGVGASRINHRCVVFKGAMYIIGGQAFSGPSANQVLSDVLTSTDGTNWTQVTNTAPWGPRADFGCVVGNTGIYIIGGYNGAGVTYNDVWFSPDGATWSQITATAAWSARSGANAVWFKNKLYLVGGESATGVVSNEVWSSTDGIVWTRTNAAAFATGVWDASVLVYNNLIWVIGGFTNSTFSPTARVYSSSDGITFTLVTSAPGFSARGAACAVAFQTPYSVSQYRYPTLWVMAGDAFGPRADVFYGAIDTPSATSYALNPTTLSQPYTLLTFSEGSELFVKNQSNAWLLQSGTLIPIVDVDYPTVTAVGAVALDSAIYVMEPNGLIHSCIDGDATQWPLLQTTPADYEDDPGIGLFKHINYVAAMGSYTTQFFYDAGNPPPGIALSPYINANVRIGCAGPQTVVSTEGTLIWVGQTEQRNLGVYMFNGLSPKRISPAWVDRAINENWPGGTSFIAAFNATAFCFGANGHTYYVLNLRTSTSVIVYDLKMDTWSIWNNASGSQFLYGAAVTTFDGGTSQDFLIGTGGTSISGQACTVGMDFYDDLGVPFTMAVQTDKLDGGNLKRKRLSRLDFVGDLNNSTVNVQYTDNDYGTLSAARPISISGMRPILGRLGSFIRRAFLFTQTDSQPARWEAVDLYLEQ